MKKELKQILKDEGSCKDKSNFLPQTSSDIEVKKDADPFEEDKDYFIRKTTFKTVKYVNE